MRFSAKFYLVAMFFVIFDLEAVFLFTWRSRSVKPDGLATPRTAIHHGTARDACLFVARRRS